jgi:hypothetical protein
MIIVQLTLDLWQQLEQIQAQSHATDWQQLCLAFDTAIDQTPVGWRLATAADLRDAISYLPSVAILGKIKPSKSSNRKPKN